MPWRALLTPEIQTFVKANENQDVKTLGLQPMPKDWPRILILDQIKARQKAAIKIPQWLSTPNLIFPSADIMEQASSTPTALYKSTLVQGQNFADLTGGAGIDTWAFCKKFSKGIAIEADLQTSQLLAHNLNLITPGSVEVQNTLAETIIDKLNPTDLIFIDPERRNKNQKGLRSFKDCKPDILPLLPKLRTTSKTIMIKASPMLDIHHAMTELPGLSEVHIVEWQDECKEVLYILKNNQEHTDIEKIPLHAVQIDDQGLPLRSLIFTREQEREAQSQLSMPQKYIYEPGPAILKSGAFKTIGTHFGLSKLHQHTHLYTSNKAIENFPGKIFETVEIYETNAKTLPIKRADLKTRNFPEKTEILQKKLKLQGDNTNTIIACTLANDKKAFIHCTKFKSSFS